MWLVICVVVVLAIVVLALLRLRQKTEKPRHTEPSTAPPIAEQPKTAPDAADVISSFETLKGGKKPIIAGEVLAKLRLGTNFFFFSSLAFADDKLIVTCSTDHIVRLYEESKCVAQVPVRSNPTYDFVAISGSAVFAFDGFESTIHVFGIVRRKNGETELKQAIATIAVVPASSKDLVKTMAVSR